MDNKEIVSTLRQIASFMELHGENEFKIRGYNNAVYNIERITDPLEEKGLAELEKVNGIGKSIAAKIHELTDTGKVAVLEDLIAQTPEGIIEMMNIKGLGTKKIRSLWQELDITTIDQLELALQNGSLDTLKGFGGKVQDKISDTIDFYLDSKTKTHYATAELYYDQISKLLSDQFPEATISSTGSMRRKMEVVSILSMVIGNAHPEKLNAYLQRDPLFTEKENSSPFLWKGSFSDCPVPVEIHISSSNDFESTLFLSTGSYDHMLYAGPEKLNLRQLAVSPENKTEKSIYERAGLPYIEPELREGLFEFQWASENKIPRLLDVKDLKGILHNHSHYSDGRHSLREMAEYCKSLGYEYLGISDHSKAAAFYANGMDEDRVKQQQDEIDELNNELAPFKIFKGIEADILPDGNIDYDDEILATFDFVVASVHSVLNMDLKKAMDRMLRAIHNPFTTMLGHLTGRQLLIREGFPLDHREIIDACVENNVIIEVNAHPNRLDLDWRWIPYSLEKNVMLSINPDAHAKDGYHDMYYGVSVARKGGLTADMTLNTKNREDIDEYFRNRKTKILSI